jgi:hypothetical protein
MGYLNSIQSCCTKMTQKPLTVTCIKLEPKKRSETEEGAIDQEDSKIIGSLSYQNFKYFEDSDSRIIYDIDEERQLGLEAVERQKHVETKRFKGINKERK